MLVKELIEELQKCNPEDIVMYNFENSFANDNFERAEELYNRHDCEYDCGADVCFYGAEHEPKATKAWNRRAEEEQW